MKIRDLRQDCWNIGFIEDGFESVLKSSCPQIHWAKKKFKDRWFADPFILDVNESEIVVLAEEFCYRLKKGRIAKVVFDRQTYEEKSFSIILDLPTHLSFPFIYRKDGNIYILPENSASGKSTIYEYNDTSESLKVLHEVSLKPFTDATLFQHNGFDWLWTTMTPDQNGTNLSVFEFDANLIKVGQLASIYSFSTKTARNAGEPFTFNNQFFRPAQDCNKCYGHGIVIQKFENRENSWIFENVNSIYPKSYTYNQGIHTLNNYKGLIVVDGRGYRSPFWGRVLTIVLKAFRLR